MKHFLFFEGVKKQKIVSLHLPRFRLHFPLCKALPNYSHLPRSHGEQMDNSVVLREWFDRVDSSRTGNVTASQLQSALAVGNLNFPLSIVQQMIRMYDFDWNGTMNFEEFLALNKFLLKALVKLGYSFDSPAFYTLCESFDEKKQGMLRLAEFISLCIFVQSASCKLQGIES